MGNEAKIWKGKNNGSFVLTVNVASFLQHVYLNQGRGEGRGGEEGRGEKRYTAGKERKERGGKELKKEKGRKKIEGKRKGEEGEEE